MIIAGTGHRPNKLGGYSDESFIKLYNIAYHWLEKNKPERVISGMALGWDQALAVAALDLKIKVIAAVPFRGQHLKWLKFNQDLYFDILSKVEKIQIVDRNITLLLNDKDQLKELFSAGNDYSIEKMQKRNEWMVDNCDKVLALWDGSSGGTANCIKYADGKKEIINLWDNFIKT